MAEDALFTVGQVAGRLNVSIPTVYRMVQGGRLEHFRVGCGRGTIRVSEAQIQRFLARAERSIPSRSVKAVKLEHLQV